MNSEHGKACKANIFHIFLPEAMQPDIHSRQGFSTRTIFSPFFYPLPVCKPLYTFLLHNDWCRNSLHHFVIHSLKISLVTEPYSIHPQLPGISSSLDQPINGETKQEPVKVNLHYNVNVFIRIHNYSIIQSENNIV